MGKESHDNYEPSAEDLANAERAFREVGADNVFSDAEHLEVEHNRQDVGREALAEMRREMFNRLLDVSDLLERTPDFPERNAAKFALSATCRLLTSYYNTSPEFRAKNTRDALESAMSALKEFDPKAKLEEEAF